MNKRQNQIEELRGLLAKAEVKISMAYSRDNQYWFASSEENTRTISYI